MQEFQAKAKIRAVFVLILIHIGLILGIYALATHSAEGWNTVSTLFLSSIACLYLGFVIGVFFIIWPILPWLKKIRSAESWIERVLRELPVFLEHLPKIIAAIQAFRASMQPVPPASAPGVAPVVAPKKPEA